MRAKLARLTDAENKAWLAEWQWQMEVGKQGQDEAARRAWAAIQRQFPRLLRYQGAKP